MLFERVDVVVLSHETRRLELQVVFRGRLCGRAIHLSCEQILELAHFPTHDGVETGTQNAGVDAFASFAGAIILEFVPVVGEFSLRGRHVELVVLALLGFSRVQVQHTVAAGHCTQNT